MKAMGRALRRSAVLATVLAGVVSTAAALAVLTWAPTKIISESGHAYAPFESTVVTGRQRAHQFYTEDDGVTAQAWYRQSVDGGWTWAAPVLLSHGAAYRAYAGAIGRYEATLDVVWFEFDSSGSVRIWYRRSLNAGMDWTVPLALTPAIGDAGKADVARVGDRVTVAYTDGVNGKIYVRISTDGGVSFGAKKAVGTTSNQAGLPISSYYEGFVSVGDAKDTITIVWDSSPTAIKTRRSTDGGTTWGTPLTLATNAVGEWISLKTAAAKIIIGYTSLTGGQYHATQLRTADEGVHWADAALIGGDGSFLPIFAYGEGWLRTAYERCTVMDCSSSATFFRTSHDFGITWGNESQASRPIQTPRAYPVGIGVGANSLCVVVYDHVNGSGGSSLYSRKASGFQV